MTTKTWTKLDDRLLQKTRVFDLRVRKMRNPEQTLEDDFFYIQTADWVNVIPVTAEKEVILVKQFRHGIQAPTLETPGGMIDIAEINPQGFDSPLETAKRELLEETGYIAGEILPLGVLHPNPAMLNNRCHIFAALDSKPEGKQNLEPTEDITLHKFPLSEIPRLISKGEITHAIVIAAFSLLFRSRPELDYSHE